MKDKIESLVAYLTLATFIFGGYQYFQQQVHDNLYLMGGLIIVTAALVLLGLNRIQKKYGVALRRYRINKDLKSIGERAVQSTDVDKILPKTGLLKQLQYVCDARAAAWASDTVLTRSNVYINVEKDNVTYRMQSIYFSPGKNETLTIYEGDLKGETLADHQSFESRVKVTPFFVNHRQWRRATLAAYEQVSESIYVPFKLSYHSQLDDLSIIIQSQHGRKSIQKDFSLKSKTLTNKHNDYKITI
jgi:hypothetical protein